MAKKKTAPRRVPRTGTPRTYSEGAPAPSVPAAGATAEATADLDTLGGTAAAPVAVRAAAPVRRGAAVGTSGVSRSQVPLSQEYRYVPGDLRNLGIIAAATFAIMIVLGILI